MNIFNNIDDVINIGNITNNSIVNADCIEAMKYIKDKSISMILCDLPYGSTKASFDSQIDLVKLWEQYKRIIKDDGCIALFGMSPFDKLLGCSNLKMLKYEWIWEKNQAVGHLNSKKRPMSSHESILIFYNKQPIYNPQMTTGHTPTHYALNKASVQNKTELYGKVNKDVESGGSTVRFPRSVLKFPSDKQTMKSTPFMHPMAKPLALCEYMIKTYTNEGDLVLDNCSGSGTVGVASKNLKRDFILIEKEQRFHEMTLGRLGINLNITV